MPGRSGSRDDGWEALEAEVRATLPPDRLQRALERVALRHGLQHDLMLPWPSGI